jgi:hypothetical protein
VGKSSGSTFNARVELVGVDALLEWEVTPVRLDSRSERPAEMELSELHVLSDR